MTSLLDDLRYAIRQARLHPLFTSVVVLTLSLAIGASTAVFTAVNGVLLASFPYPDAGQLVEVSSSRRFGGASYADLQDWRSLETVFAGVAGYKRGPGNLQGDGIPQEIEVARVTPEFFRVLGTRPSMGRDFGPEDELTAVAILSHSFWAAYTARDPGIIGRQIPLDGRSYEVIGVMPPEFDFPSPAVRAWLPIGEALQSPIDARFNRGVRTLGAVARMAPGIPLERARTQLDLLSRRIVEGMIGSDSTAQDGQLIAAVLRDEGYGIRSLRDAVVGRSTESALFLLSGAVVLVLLVACVNTANLLVARSAARRREVAVRQALGASRRRLVRQLLTESVLLSSLAALVGLLLAERTLHLLLALWPAALPRASAVELNGTVLLFTSVVAMLTGVLSGLMPAWRATSLSLDEVLREDSTGTTSARRRRLQTSLVVAQVAMTFVLLVSASLFIRSFAQVLGVDQGFDRGQVVAARLRLAAPAYVTGSEQLRFFDEVLADLRRRPEVHAAAITSTLPLTGAGASDLAWFSPGSLKPGTPIMVAVAASVSPSYFEVMGLRVRQGRALATQDAPGGTRSAVISAALARTLWVGEDPIGKLLPLDTIPRGPAGPVLVVGVADNLRTWSLERNEIADQVFLSVAQDTALPQAWVVARAVPGTEGLATAIRDVVARVDRRQPVGDLVTLDELTMRQTAARRFHTTLILVFAAVAVLLAVVGIAGLTSYTVSQRRREIGIRQALGARPQQVVVLLLKESMLVVCGGLALGLVISPAAASFLSSMLFGVSTTDSVTYAAATTALLAVAVLATLVPATRALQVSPVETLRAD